MRTSYNSKPNDATHARYVPESTWYYVGFVWYKVVDGVVYKQNSTIKFRLNRGEWIPAKLSKSTREQLFKLPMGDK